MIDVALPKPHEAQRQVEQDARRFNVWCCGRRWGKDVLLERRAVKKLIKTKYPVGWFAPTYRMMQENYRALKNILSPIITRASETEHRIEIMTGNVLDFWSLDNPDSARGRRYGYVAINEAAMVSRLGDAWNMVIRPTLADFKGGADFGSTPKGLNGFYELWKQAADDPDWSRARYKTDDNPHIPPEEVTAMRESLPERVVRQEIDAEFVEDGAYFQNIEQAAIIEERETPEKHAGHNFYMAADWGKSGDWSVFGVSCRECNRVVDWDRFNQIDYIYQRQRLGSLYHRWNPVILLPERNSIGEPNIEMLMQEGFAIGRGQDGKPGFYTGPTTKPPLIEALAQSFIIHGFKVPKEAKDELTMFEVNIMQSGHNQFSAPAGQHDDWVLMLAILWHAMSLPPLFVGRY